MGMGATNTLDRMCASVGIVNGVDPQFKHSLDVANAGVLLTLPALLSNGLLRQIDKYFVLPSGYYTLQQIFLVIAFLALCRIKSLEQLRYCAPGEWGKVLGLDRIPEVKTLREKIDIVSQQKTTELWSSTLCSEWMEAEPENAGVFCVDGHVRVYHGSQTKLPHHYVARQKLCLRATVDYWVNALDGKPFLRVNQAVDPGLIKVLLDEIIPKLKKEVPGQPTEEELTVNPYLHSFTVITDREGYSPDYFLQMKKQRIAVTTYHKFPKDQWALHEFSEYVCKKNLQTLTVQRAERGTRLSNGLWVREIRKLGEGGHQTSLISTDYISDLKLIAIHCQQRSWYSYCNRSYQSSLSID
jgi:hypothetical protein